MLRTQGDSSLMQGILAPVYGSVPLVEHLTHQHSWP